MPGTIIIGGFEAASNADILQGTRLQSAPQNGWLFFEMQAADNVAANNYTASIQLPGGDTPMNGTPIPGGTSAGVAGILDDRLALRARFRIRQGGHCVFSVTETGDTEATWRVTFQPG